MAVLVQGILRYPDNTPIAGASIKFIANKFISSGVPIGASLEIVTDSIGAYSQNLLAGSYHIFYKKAGQELYTHIIDAHLLEGMGGVAIGAPITIEAIIGTLPGDVPIYTGCASIPAPTAFTAASGFTTILLSWEGTNYTCHSVTEIWVSATNDFATKVLLDTTEAQFYSHPIGHDGTRYYWIRFRNANSAVGNWFSTTPVTGQTSQNPGEVLADLQQDVYNSAIFNSLRTNINSSFYKADPPTSKPNGDPLISGDVWVDSDNNQKHVWDTSQVPPSWLAIIDKDAQDALTALVGTQEVADGEIRGFFQTTEPLYAESSFGDIWIDTSQNSPLTFTAIKRFEDASSRSTGTLSWRSAPTSALGLSYVKAYNTEGDLADLQSDYNTFTTTTLPNNLSAIQSQIDGSITTWYGDTSPTLTNTPASGWDYTNAGTNALVFYNNHLGDLYYDRITGYAYRFAYEDLPDDSPDAGVIYSWIKISDSDIATAISNAATAQDTADGKRRVFVVEPTPPYDVGDLWTNGVTIRKCKIDKASGASYAAADWEVATTYITTYYQAGTRVNGSFTTAPTTPNTGDMWVVTDEGDAVYRYGGSAWVLLSVATLANVNTAILEQKGICKVTGANYAGGSIGDYVSINRAACDAEPKTTWEEVGALAKRTDTVSTTVGTNTATIATQGTSINGLEAEYSVKIDNNGHVSGFGLSSGIICLDSSGDIVYDTDGSTITDATTCTTLDATNVMSANSNFVVAASTFAVTGTTETPVIPFIIRTGGTSGTCYVAGTATTHNEATCATTTGGSWVAANTSIVGIQGSLVLDGTMNAKAIVAGSITADEIASNAITANKIKANAIDGTKISATAKITAGSGNNVGVLDGANSTYRIYAGHANPALAPFRVEQDGTVTIEKSNGTGKLVIDGDAIKVYTTSGGVDTIRVKLGSLL